MALAGHSARHAPERNARETAFRQKVARASLSLTLSLSLSLVSGGPFHAGILLVTSGKILFLSEDEEDEDLSENAVVKLVAPPEPFQEE